MLHLRNPLSARLGTRRGMPPERTRWNLFSQLNDGYCLLWLYTLRNRLWPGSNEHTKSLWPGRPPHTVNAYAHYLRAHSGLGHRGHGCLLLIVACTLGLINHTATTVVVCRRRAFQQYVPAPLFHHQKPRGI